MSSTGAGYDYSPTVYSPDGRLYQTEYGDKAVQNGGTALGVRCKDGIVLAAEKMLLSKMLCEGSNRRVHAVDLHAGIVTAGFAPDGRQLVNRARSMCANFKENYGVDIPPEQLANQLGQFVHAHTCYHYLRPFGAACIVSGYDADKGRYELYCVQSNGLTFRFVGAAIGKGARGAKTEIERGDFANLTCEEALPRIAKIIGVVHDDVKDKQYELELGWVCDGTGHKQRLVPAEMVAAARERADAEIKAEEEEDESDDDDDDDDDEE